MGCSNKNHRFRSMWCLKMSNRTHHLRWYKLFWNFDKGAVTMVWCELAGLRYVTEFSFLWNRMTYVTLRTFESASCLRLRNPIFIFEHIFEPLYIFLAHFDCFSTTSAFVIYVIVVATKNTIDGRPGYNFL